MTTDSKELVKRLRDGWSVSLRQAAADALEAMAGEVERLATQRDAEHQRYLKAYDLMGRESHRAEAAEAERDRTRADYEAMKAHNKELFGKLSAAELERDRLKAALDWALGEGDEWPERKPGEGAFYWRAELRRKALGGDAS